MGLFDFFKKPDPQKTTKIINEAMINAKVLIDQGNYENALKTLLKVKELGWNNDIFVMQLTEVYYRTGQYNEFTECGKRAVELYPEYEREYISMERAFHKNRDHDQAEAADTTTKEEHSVPAEAADATPSAAATDAATPDTPRIRELYQELANLIKAMIPEEWSTVYFYGEVLPDSGSAYFFYRRPSDNELIYSHDLTRKYRVDKRVFGKQMLAIFHSQADLNREYAANYEKVWTNLTLILERSGKFDIKFGYEDVLHCGYDSFDRRKIWMYEVIGVEPEDDEGKALIQRYLESK